MNKILICDDQRIVSEGLESILKADPDFNIAGIAFNGEEAVILARETAPDLVLMDLKMPVLNGVLATRKLKEILPETKVLVLTTYAEDDWVIDAVRAGADGYLLKGTPRKHLINAIKGTIEGKTFIDPEVGHIIFVETAKSTEKRDTKALEKLTNREVEILKLIANGYSNHEIAIELNLSKGTVANYLSGIFLKLQVADRTQAAILAVKLGLV